MNFSLKVFNEIQEQLIGELQQVKYLFDEAGVLKEKRKLNESIEQIKDHRFKIVVVGEFNRGKSTFINALLGDKILPSKGVPATTILNRITYNQEPFFKLIFNNEDTKPETISHEKFKTLVAPRDPIEGDEESELIYKESVEQINRIKYAEIGYPIDFCRDGVEVIDSPGTNDLDPRREELTNHIIPQSDAAILILTATKILSKSELSFLKDRLLESDIQKVFIVINKKDQLQSQDEEQKVTDFVREHLKGILDHPKIHLVSSLQALYRRQTDNGMEIKKRGRVIHPLPIEKTGFPELELDLAEFLQYERGLIKLEKPIIQTIKSIDVVLKDYINFEKRSLTTKIDHLQEKTQAVRQEIFQVKESGGTATNKIAMQLHQEEDHIISWYNAQLEAMLGEIIDTFDNNWRLTPEELSRIVEEQLAKHQKRIHELKNKKVQETIGNIISNNSVAINAKWQSLNINFNSILNPKETNASLFQIGHNDVEEDAVSLMFEDIYNDLSSMYHNSGTLTGKVATGMGMALTTFIGGATYFIRGLFGLFTSASPQQKLKSEITNQLLQMQKEKVKGLRKEWHLLERAVSEQYQKNIEEHTEGIERQLTEMIENSRLEETEIQKKLSILANKEGALLKSKDNLISLSKKMHAQKEAVV